MEVFASRFEVLVEIKSDGGRSLYRARDTQLDHDVALKVVELDGQQARDELLGEVKILRRLEPHSALPTMREGFSLDDDRYAIVMDWVEGRNLADVLEERGSPGLASKTVVEYVRQVAAALDHLHRHSPAIVHGDVKPSNLVLTPTGKVVLVDFGIAHQVGTSVDAGTRGYVAPEVSRGAPSSPAADVFGLAATAYALLTGSPPDHTQPPDLDPDPVVARVLANALKQGLATDPARRPSTAGELADRLAAASQTLPSGVVTFLALELMGSVEFFDSDDEDVEALRDRLDDILTTTIDEHGGRSLRGPSDAELLSAVFTSSSMAAIAAIAVHERIEGLRVPAEFGVMARVALHTGDVQLRNGTYSGATVNRARRSLARTDPGRTLVSHTTAALIRGTLPSGAHLVEVPVEGVDALFLLLAAYDEVSVDAEPSRPIGPRTSMPTLPDWDASPRRDALVKYEWLADAALRSGDRCREAGDAERAAEYERNAEAFANRVIELRREIAELERVRPR
jgi:tRNA A-37 threonylcarbamoyl transferase component Bud32/class 3 adenylate cyclase